MKRAATMTAEQFRATASESDVQKAIKDTLEWAGYEVEETSERRRRCTECGMTSHAGTGVTRAIGDLLVRNPRWSVTACKINLEVKNARGRLSAEQADAENRRAIVVVRSAEEAILVMERIEAAMQRAVSDVSVIPLQNKAEVR